MRFQDRWQETWVKDEDQAEDRADTDGPWTWDGDEQSHFDGDSIFFQGSDDATSGGTVTLEAFHSDGPSNKFTKDFTLLRINLKVTDPSGSAVSDDDEADPGTVIAEPDEDGTLNTKLTAEAISPSTQGGEYRLSFSKKISVFSDSDGSTSVELSEDSGHYVTDKFSTSSDTTYYVSAPNDLSGVVDVKLQWFENSEDSSPAIEQADIVRLLKVDVEFQNSKMSDWKNVQPDPSVVTRIGVIRGDDVDFQIADSSSLPVSELSWSGEEDGTGDSISITFDELGEREVILELADNEIARALVTVAEPTGVNEAGWILAHPSVLGSIQGIRDEAEEWVQDNLDALGGGWTNGRGDAARHAYWSGLMALFWGHDYSGGLGTAHEVTGLQSQNADHNSTVMDLENNAVGRSLASPGMTIDQLRQAVRGSLDSGALTILDEIENPQEKGLLQPSNQ